MYLEINLNFKTWTRAELSFQERSDHTHTVIHSDTHFHQEAAQPQSDLLVTKQLSSWGLDAWLKGHLNEAYLKIFTLTNNQEKDKSYRKWWWFK